MEYIDPVIGFVEEPEASNCSFKEFNDSLLRTIADSTGIPKELLHQEKEKFEGGYFVYYETAVKIKKALRKRTEPFHVATLYQFGKSRKSLWARYPHYTKAQIRKFISGGKRIVSLRGKCH